MHAQECYDLLQQMFKGPHDHTRNGIDHDSNCAWIYVDEQLVQLGRYEMGAYWASFSASGWVGNKSAVEAVRGARDYYVDDLRTGRLHIAVDKAAAERMAAIKIGDDT